MKKYLLIAASFVFLGCSTKDKAPIERNYLEESAKRPAATVPADEPEAAVETRSDELMKQNEDLKMKVTELERKMATDEQDSEKRLKSMEDLVALMEQKVRTMDETGSAKNYEAVSPPIPAEPMQSTATIADDLAGSGAENLAGISTDDVPSPNVLPLDAAAPTPAPLPPASDSILFIEDEAAPIEESGQEPFEEISSFSDPDLNPPEKFPKLTQHPRAKDYYDEAYGAYVGKEYPEAIDRFSDLLRLFPNDQYSDNAAFWVGMAHYHLGNADKAEIQFRRVLKNYEHGKTSEGFKTPDAIHMLGRIREEQNNFEEANYYYDSVIRKYPESVSADRSSERMKLMTFKKS